MADSRTKNTKRNIVWGVVNKVLLALLPFIIRTIIIKEIGVEYVGLNSLFTSILNVLSLAELGFNTSVIFVMYRGVANDDTIKLSALLGYIKRVYLVIGTVITIFGLLCTPFLRSIIHDVDKLPEDINIYVIYLILLANITIGYFFGAYRNSLFCAYQRNDIVSNIGTGTQLFFSTLQILLLIFFKNYYIYIITLPFITLSQNYLYVRISKKLYPKITPYGTLSVEEKKELKKLVTGTFIGKIGGVLSVSLDNIVISAFLGITILAYYSNYHYILTTIQGFLVLIYSSMQGAIGNSLITESLEKNRSDLHNFTFIYNWIVGICTFCLYFLIQPFIYLWIGKEGMLPDIIVILLCVYFFITLSFGIQGTYKQALGIVWEDRYRPLVGGLVNIALKIMFVLFLRQYGDTYSLIGVLLSTIIAQTFVNTPWGVYVTYKGYFKTGQKRYYGAILTYFVVTIAVCAVCIPIFNLLPTSSGGIGVLYIMIRLFAAIVLSNALFILIYHKTLQYKIAKQYILERIK